MLSVHTHNDRGSAVAAAELAMLAGAERVEGPVRQRRAHRQRRPRDRGHEPVLAGCGPGVDFSELPSLVEAYETCNQMPFPARQPYAGELVFTAFSRLAPGRHRQGLGRAGE